MDKSRIYNNWPLAREGFPFVSVGCALILFFSYLGLFFTALLAAMSTVFVILFFRDPDRKNNVEQNAVLTPADGKILEVRHFQDTDNPLGEPFVKVSIFMSIFNVHVNRIPIGGIIEKITYRPGKFFSANLDKASKYNEKNMITLQTSDSRKIVFIQIAGIIARRIACWIEEGERVQAGQRFGLIRFGSRLEVYLPADSQISVSLDQKVKAGKTIIGYLS